MDDDPHDKVVKRVLAGVLAAVLTALFWVPEISEWVIEMWVKLNEDMGARRLSGGALWFGSGHRLVHADR